MVERSRLSLLQPAVITANQLKGAHDVNTWSQVLAKLDGVSIERIQLADSKRLFGDTIPRDFVAGIVNSYTSNYCAMIALLRPNYLNFRGYTLRDITTGEYRRCCDELVVTTFSHLLLRAHRSVSMKIHGDLNNTKILLICDIDLALLIACSHTMRGKSARHSKF